MSCIWCHWDVNCTCCADVGYICECQLQKKKKTTTIYCSTSLSSANLQKKKRCKHGLDKLIYTHVCVFILCCTADTYEACRNPGIPAFGVQVSEKQFYQAGEILHFSCQSGYKLIGEANIRCVPSRPAKWSHPPPVCKGSLYLQPIVKHMSFFLHCLIVLQFELLVVLCTIKFI